MLNNAERIAADLIRAAFPLQDAAVPASVVSPPLWAEVVTAAERHGLATLLYAALKAPGQRVQAPEHILETLRGIYMRTSALNHWAYQELDYWLERFEREHIRVILLKGCALASALYDETQLRPVGDLDLLVPRIDAERARGLLVAQGYAPFIPERRSDCEMRFSYEAALARGGPHPSQIDLHWHLFSVPYYAARIPIEWFWQRTLPIRVNQRASQMFTPAAQLIYLSTHCAVHRWERMLGLYDIALLLSHHGAQIKWDEVTETAAAFDLGRIVLTTLERVGACWGITLAPDGAARLQALQPSRAERLVFAATTVKRTEALIFLQGLTTPGFTAKLRFWLCYALPSAQYMQDHYHLRDRQWLAPYYVWRIVSGLFQVLRSLLTMVFKRV
jgi:putative nucleotidyltransferase-like protein